MKSQDSVLQQIQSRLTQAELTAQGLTAVLSSIDGLDSEFSFRLPQLLQEIELPEQTYRDQEFSQYPVTLLSHRGVNFDLYHWRGSHTSIHDHHFFGAFKVLRGTYVQRSYQFKNSQTVLPGLSIGDLVLLNERRLAIGEVVAIPQGESFIHETWHPNEECVTACLRLAQPVGDLHSYLSPGVRISHTRWGEEVMQRMSELLVESKRVESIMKLLPDLLLLQFVFSIHLPAKFSDMKLKETALSVFEGKFKDEAWFSVIQAALKEQKLNS